MTELNEFIDIDESLCDGCGLCLPSCDQGALRLADGKVQFDETLCDGLLNCLGSCPNGAITVSRRESAAPPKPKVSPRPLVAEAKKEPAQAGTQKLKDLANWPIKLELASPSSPNLKVPELVLAADCVGFAYPGFRRFLGEKPLLIGCPKLHSEAYLDKLVAIFGAHAGLRKITVAMMTLPCCQGLKWYALEALKKLGRDVAVESIAVTLKGEVSPVMEG